VLESPPRQWRVYVVDLEPRVGTKPGKHRPCVSIQPSEFAAAGHPRTVIVPLTTRTVPEDAFPLRVRPPAGTCGREPASDALIDQLLNWDNTLFRTDLGEVPEALEERIRSALVEFLDL
jgi:mRNA interferase MazF